MKQGIKDVKEYFESFPEATQNLLKQMQATIKKAAPEAEETINYGMPTFKLYGNLVHYAAYKNHIGFYPGSSGIAAFINEISKYKNAKGSVQFPINEPLPLELVTKIVSFRINQNMKKVELKLKKK